VAATLVSSSLGFSSLFKKELILNPVEIPCLDRGLDVF